MRRWWVPVAAVLGGGLGWLAAAGAAGQAFRVKEIYGARGRGRTELREPVDAAVGVNGDVAVLDRARGALVFFTELGTWVRTVGDTNGPSSVSLRNPSGVACDGRGDFWVADTGNHRLVVLGADGTPRRTVGSLGSAAGSFRLPTDVAFDRAGRVYVADQGNERVQVFREDGTWAASWERRTKQRHERLSNPRSVAYSDYSRGFVWVVNEGSARLECFAVDRAGEWDSGIDVAALAGGAVRLERVRIEPTFYRMFVADSEGKRVLVVSRRGELLGELGEADGAPVTPTGLSVTRLLDVCVADPASRRVVRYGERFDR